MDKEKSLSMLDSDPPSEAFGPDGYWLDPNPVLTTDVEYNIGELARYMRKNNKTYFDLTQEEIDMFIINDTDKN